MDNDNNSGRQNWRHLPRNVWVLTAGSFLTDVSSEMLTSLVPLFLFNVLGSQTSVIGLIEGVAETTASLLKIVSGSLSDRLGKRKWLTVSGYALSTVAKPFLYFANGWVWVLGVRFADRVGKGLRTAPRDALVADSIDKSRRGLAFGLHRAGDTAGAAVGLLVALLVVWWVQRGALVLERPAFNMVVVLSVIPAALAVLLLAVGVTEPRRTQQAADEARAAQKVPFDRKFKFFLVLVVLFTLGNSSDAFLVLRAQSVGLPVLGVLGMMLTFNLVYAGVSGPAGVLSDRIGRRWLISGGWVVYGLIYLGFARLTSAWQAWALMGVYGIYYGLTEGVAKAYVGDLVPAARRGAAYGIFNAAVGLTALPASVIAGILWQGAWGWAGFGPAAPFYFGAALSAIAAALLLLVRP